MSDDAKKEKTNEIPERRLVRTLSDNFHAYYTNNSEIGMTTWDMSLRFARIIGADGGDLHVEDQAVITMSLHHAKALSIILTNYIRQYERDNGKLFVPAGLVQDVTSDQIKTPTSMFHDEEAADKESK